MTAPLHRPTTELVAQAWLQLAVPGVGVDEELPAVNTALRTVGFIRTHTIDNAVNRYVPLREPVVVAECWLAPDAKTGVASWARAGQLAEKVVDATFDPVLMGVLIDLSSAGSYSPARVHTVTAISGPRRFEDDPTGFARVDVDLEFLWTAQ